MNFGTFVFALVIFGGPAAWVLWDSSKRYEKPSWLLAVLTPVTLWASVALYVVKRLFKKPVELPAVMPKAWQMGAVAVSIVGLSVAVSGTPNSSSQPAQVPATPSGPVDHYKRALGLADHRGFAVALKELYLVPKGHKDFEKAQAKIPEYKMKLAALRREEAKQNEARRKAEAAAALRVQLEAEREEVARHPENFLEIVNASWTKGGFDSICMATLTIKNKSHVPLGDIEVVAKLAGESGTQVSNSFMNSKTINKVIQPGGTRIFREVNMGFISDQASSASFEVTGAKVLE